MKEFADLGTVNVLLICCKILRKIGTQLVEFITRNNMILDVQSAFRKSYSTAIVLSKLAIDIAHNIDNGMVPCLRLLNYFESVQYYKSRAITS